MKRSVHLSSLFFFLCIVPLIAQSMNEGLAIGNKVPNVVLKNMINYKFKEAKLSDFHGKIVIIDFWSKYCSACINGFPKMEQLQRKFEKDIQVLLVTQNNEKDLEYLFQHSPNVINNKLPMVIGDSSLHKLFPHYGEPYLVWIDRIGNVMATTQSEEATEENIQLLLDGQSSVLALRHDKIDFNYNVPLMKEGKGRQWQHLKYYSMFMDWVEDFPGSIVSSFVDTVNRKISEGRHFLNVPIISLYKIAYSNGEDIPVIVEAKNREMYFKPVENTGKMEEWRRNNVYSYELVLPNERKDDWVSFMKQDLERFFMLKGIVEKRRIPCLVLSVIGGSNKFKTKGGSVISEKTRNGWVFRNVSLDKLKISLLHKYIGTAQFPVFIDSTNYKGKVDMDLKADIEDLPALEKELTSYGLNIRKIEMETTCLVIKEVE